MVVLIIAMLLTLALALVVVGYVALSARREGRDLLTPHGERMVTLVRQHGDVVRERTGVAVDVARQRTAARRAAQSRRADQPDPSRDDAGLPAG